MTRKNHRDRREQHHPSQPGYLTRPSYRALFIEGFKTFARVQLDHLSRVNLILGSNNTGKTTILEAIYAHACGHNFGAFENQVVLRRGGNLIPGPLDLGDKHLAVFRNTTVTPFTFRLAATLEDGSDHEFRHLFYPSAEIADLDPRLLGSTGTRGPVIEYTELLQHSPSAVSQLTMGGARSLQARSLGRWKIAGPPRASDYEVAYPLVSSRASPPFKLATLQDILSHRAPEADIRVFGTLKRYDLLGEFITEMRRTFPVIENIDSIPYPDGTASPVYITTKGRQLPIHAFGDGLRRWYYLLGNLIAYPSGTHCIEEIDATMHPGAHEHFSKLLVSYARRFNSQVFLTTHSIEFVDAFLRALYGSKEGAPSGEPDLVRVFTLRAGGDPTRPEVWSLSGNEAYEQRHKFALELR